MAKHKPPKRVDHFQLRIRLYGEPKRDVALFLNTPMLVEDGKPCPVLEGKIRPLYTDGEIGNWQDMQIDVGCEEDSNG